MSNPTNEAPNTRLDRPHFGRLLLHLALISCLSMGLLVQPAQAGDKQEGKVRNSRWVYEEVLQSPARSLPTPMLEATKCVAIFPGLNVIDVFMHSPRVGPVYGTTAGIVRPVALIEGPVENQHSC